MLVALVWRYAWDPNRTARAGSWPFQAVLSHCLLAPLLRYSVVETCFSQAQEEASNLRLTATIPLLNHLLVVPMCGLSKE